MFLELGILLNIAIWGRFYVLIGTHRAIRYDEVFHQIMYEQDDQSLAKKNKHLRTFKNRSYVMYLIVAVSALALSTAYLFYSGRIINDEFF